MDKVIVFGNDHTNSVGVIQSLGKAGYKSIGLLYGNKTGLVLSSKYTERIITAKDPQSCIDILIKENFDEEIIPIIATADIAAITLERNSKRLKGRFRFEYSTKYSLEYLAKKENQVKLANAAGFNVPKSWSLSDLNTIPNVIPYPCIIKPLVSCEGAKSDIRVCWNRVELNNNLFSLHYTRNVILQQYINRDYEISILGCALSNGECIIPVIENKLTLYPKYVGLECLAYLQALDDTRIKQNIENLINIIGYVGLFSVEMMHSKDDGQFYFTEINLRNDGAGAFITKFGANLPRNHVEDLIGLPITNTSEYSSGYYIWEMHHFLSLLHRDISFISWVKEIIKSRGFLLYFEEDSKPFYKQFSNWILYKLHLRKNESY